MNFFDVAGYPHYENVISNILCFFFDTREEHDFNDLWVKALLDVYINKTKELIDVSNLSSRNALREYSNGSDKRIDLLLDYRPLIIVIENKIYASADYNPFDIYDDMAKSYIKDNQIKDYKLIKILLSVNHEGDKANNFINITYDELIDKVKASWEYDASNKWHILMKEFISNLLRKKEDMNMKMNKEWIEFVKANGNTLFDLYKQTQNDIDERLNVLRRINELLNDLDIKHGVYNSRYEKYVSQYNDIVITKENKSLVIESYFMKEITNDSFEDYDKLYISLWCRLNKQNDFDDALNAIGKKDIAKEKTTIGKGAWGKHYILDEIDITQEFSIVEIANKIKEYVLNIKKIND